MQLFVHFCFRSPLFLLMSVQFFAHTSPHARVFSVSPPSPPPGYITVQNRFPIISTICLFNIFFRTDGHHATPTFSRHNWISFQSSQTRKQCFLAVNAKLLTKGLHTAPPPPHTQCPVSQSDKNAISQQNISPQVPTFKIGKILLRRRSINYQQYHEGSIRTIYPPPQWNDQMNNLSRLY